jgi:hypothetical protein
LAWRLSPLLDQPLGQSGLPLVGHPNENGHRREPAAPFCSSRGVFSMLRAAFLLMGRNAARHHNPDKSRSTGHRT